MKKNRKATFIIPGNVQFKLIDQKVEELEKDRDWWKERAMFYSRLLHKFLKQYNNLLSKEIKRAKKRI